jgi:ATP-binding cassette subfamily B protein
MIDKSGKMLIEQNNIIYDYIQKIDTYRILNINVYDKWKENNYNYMNLRKIEGIFHGIKLLIFQSFDDIIIILLILLGIIIKIDYKIIFIFISYKKSIFTIVHNYNEIRLSIVRNKISLDNINNFFNDNTNIIMNGNYIPLNIIPIIKIKDLTFSYKDKKIFDKFNLIIPNNIITGISGCSGKGKSTLIKILLGLYSYEGDITIDNINIKDIDYNYYYNNLISYVGQEPILYTGSIYENLISNLDDKDIDKNLLNKLLEKLDIVNLDNENLSGGEKQRLSICRAFLRKSKIILLDEPTSSLDYDNENNVLNLIKELNEIYKITIILVSHSNNAISICDKIIKL